LGTTDQGMDVHIWTRLGVVQKNHPNRLSYPCN